MSAQGTIASKLSEEGVHPASDDEAWQESVFLAWYDRERGIGGIHRLGIEPNRGLSNMWCGIFRDGGKCFRHNDQGVPLKDYPGGKGFQCGPQAFFHNDRSIFWTLDDEDCQVRLELEDLPSGNLWTENTESMAAVSIIGHFHHHCRVRGTVTLEGKTFEIDGCAWRDHSWGPRHWGSILHHRCFSGSFSDDHAIDFYSLLDEHGALSRGGVIASDGEVKQVKDFHFTVAIDDDGLTAESADVTGTLPDGKPFAARFDLAGAVVVETREYVGIETVGTITLDSGETGFGYMAVSNNARAGRAQPPLSINAISQAGLSDRHPRAGA